jgi:hypothetical protein
MQSQSIANRKSLEVFQYTDASFIVYGNATKEFKTELKELKGSFSTKLKNFPAPAWLFSMGRLESVKDFIETGDVIVAELPEYVEQPLIHSLRRL